jgi:hypothetical protein
VPALQAGARRTFYCTTWKLGSGLALNCLGHRAPEPAARQLRDTPLAQASINVGGADLRSRVATADLVVHAEVVSIEPAPPQEGPISEHDPHWQKALLQVASMVRGRKSAKPVLLYFPASQDVAWFGAPRPVPAQRGVWLLRAAARATGGPKAARGLAAVPAGAYTALHPLDFQPDENLPAVRSLAQAAAKAEAVAAVRAAAKLALQVATTAATKSSRKTPR